MTFKMGASVASLALSVLLVGCTAAPETQDAPADTQSEAQTQTDGVADAGDNVAVHYRGTLEDGTQFDSSYDRGEPLEFEVGAGQMISGFDQAVEGMKVGEKKTVTLAPEEAYGDVDPSLVIDFPKSDVPNADDLKVGDSLMLRTATGQSVAARVVEIGSDTVTVDANHELAGKPLTFEIELVSTE